MSAADRAIAACREAAAALDAMPVGRMTLLGPCVSTDNLREEADWIERQQVAWKSAVE